MRKQFVFRIFQAEITPFIWIFNKIHIPTQEWKFSTENKRLRQARKKQRQAEALVSW
jgi:hypothetical protein